MGIKNQGIEFAKEIVNEVDKKVKRIYWTNEEIDNYFARRPYDEIINQKNTGFMNPCSDLTLVTSNLLTQEKIPHQWIIQEEAPTKDFNFPRLHFALKFQYKNKPHVLNYIRNNEVYVSQGTSALEKNKNIIQRIIIPSKKIDLDKSVYQNLTNSDFAHYFERFSLEKVLARLKKDNSPENFEMFKQIRGEEFIIKQQ